MFGFGILLVLLGAASFILPMMGRQLVIMAPLEPLQPWAGIAVIAAGVVLSFFGMKGKKKQKQ